MEKVEIIEPYHCDKCGKKYGRTNACYYEVPVWFVCDCSPKGKIYLLNLDNILLDDPGWQDSENYFGE